jgi:hypothetical protein
VWASSAQDHRIRGHSLPQVSVQLTPECIQRVQHFQRKGTTSSEAIRARTSLRTEWSGAPPLPAERSFAQAPAPMKLECIRRTGHSRTQRITLLKPWMPHRLAVPDHEMKLVTSDFAGSATTMQESLRLQTAEPIVRVKASALKEQLMFTSHPAVSLPRLHGTTSLEAGQPGCSRVLDGAECLISRIL